MVVFTFSHTELGGGRALKSFFLLKRGGVKSFTLSWGGGGAKISDQ